jgi:hypothetical protein
VIGFSQDLTHGTIASSQQFSKWDTLVDRMTAQRPESVIVWMGDNVSDVIFLAMVCDRLSTLSANLERVRVPGIDARPFVTMHSPEQIAKLYATRVALTAEDRAKQAMNFTHICDACAPIRRLENGQVIGVPANYYDTLLLGACSSEWRATALVVGAAMANCDGQNLMSDDFFNARLCYLIETRSIESNMHLPALRDCSVRLAPC